MAGPGVCVACDPGVRLCCAAEVVGKAPSVPTVPVSNGSVSIPPPVSTTPPVALHPKKRLRFRLAEKAALSHNVRRFRFALPLATQRFGLPVGKHVFLYAECVPPLCCWCRHSAPPAGSMQCSWSPLLQVFLTLGEAVLSSQYTVLGLTATVAP